MATSVTSIENLSEKKTTNHLKEYTHQKKLCQLFMSIIYKQLVLLNCKAFIVVPDNIVVTEIILVML